MPTITIDDLRQLIARREGWAVSMYLPTFRAGIDTQQGHIRLKNLIRQAEDQLVERGLRRPEAKDLLAASWDLTENEMFWQYQNDGLVVFATQDFTRHFWLPIHFNEQLTVNERFYLKPLAPLLNGDGLFYVLALSQNEVRFFKGNRTHLDEVTLDEVPHSLADALFTDVHQEYLQFTTFSQAVAGGGMGGTTRRQAVFHGSGNAKDVAKDNLLQYFQQINKGVKGYLKDSRAPLVLAGVKYLFPIYRQANAYQHIMDEGIDGNPETLDVGELHQRAWDIVGSYYAQTQSRALNRYGEASHTDLASTDLREIVPAAINGRVDTLFVTQGLQQWGRYDPQSNQVTIHPQCQPDDEDLSDLAVVETLANDGTVYALKPGDMPESASAAAIFRYAYQTPKNA